MKTWAIVENAGYVGECVIRTGIKTHAEAFDIMYRLYDEDERADLHVDIARETEDGFSYDY